MTLKQFNIVISLAGRDTGNLYLVSEVLDENYCLLIDGKTKPISKPKKKKFKHLKLVGDATEILKDNFNDKSKTNDAKIRKILKEFEKTI